MCKLGEGISLCLSVCIYVCGQGVCVVTAAVNNSSSLSLASLAARNESL